MFITLDLESDEPIYTQLKDQIIAGIARRELSPGEALPSVRSLAADLGINFHTVLKAYQQLKQEGFILIHRQKGVVVNPDGVPPADDTYLSELKSLYLFHCRSGVPGCSGKGFFAALQPIFCRFLPKE